MTTERYNQQSADSALWLAALETRLAELIEARLPKRTLSPGDGELWRDRLVADLARARARALTELATDFMMADAQKAAQGANTVYSEL